VLDAQGESNCLRDELEQSMARELQLMDQLRKQPLESILQSKNQVIEHLQRQIKIQLASTEDMRTHFESTLNL
jgi:hypothetical protein